MRILKTILQTIWMGVYLAFGLLTAWISRHILPVCVFGGLLGTILVIGWFAPADIREHIFSRQFSVHFGWGALLYMLLSRLVLFGERHSDGRLPWLVWYLLPLVLMLGINATNEWGLAMTPPPNGCPECPWWGGDWARAVFMHNDPLRWKSIADLAGWQFGGLAAAWWSYFMSKRLIRARLDYLTAIGKIERSNNGTT